MFKVWVELHQTLLRKYVFFLWTACLIKGEVVQTQWQTHAVTHSVCSESVWVSITGGGGDIPVCWLLQHMETIRESLTDPGSSLTMNTRFDTHSEQSCRAAVMWLHWFWWCMFYSLFHICRFTGYTSDHRKRLSANMCCRKQRNHHWMWWRTRSVNLLWAVTSDLSTHQLSAHWFIEMNMQFYCQLLCKETTKMSTKLNNRQ